MALYGLIGYPLSHSWSADWFNKKFGAEQPVKDEYRLFQMEDLKNFMSLIEDHPELAGLNVTIPYKEKIIPFLDELDKTALEIGAVNTIRISRAGKKTRLKGYNTDAAGFIDSADFSGYPDALILGTGGAAKAVYFALNHLGISTLFVSRNPRQGCSIGYNNVTTEVLNKYRLIINATPLGMFPDTDSFPPIPYDFLDQKHFLYDLAYNPPETLFLAKAQKAGARIMNGLRMLQIQAERSYEIWKEQL